MAYLSEPAIALAREMRDRLAADFSTIDASVSFDSNHLPSFRVGTSGAGNQTAFIEVSPASTANLDVLGLNQNVYTPYVVNIVVEQISGNTGTLILLGAAWANLIADIAPFGTAVSVYLVNQGTNPAVGGITGTPALSWPGVSAKYPLMATI